MRLLLKLVILVVVLAVGYNWLRDGNEDVKQLEYELTTTSIKQVVSNPERYKEVTLSGRVKTSINILGVGYYSLQDTEDSDYVIWVKPKSEYVPNEGSLQKVSGRVRQRLKVGRLEMICIEEK